MTTWREVEQAVPGWSCTHLNAAASLLVVEWWTPGGGLPRVERE